MSLGLGHGMAMPLQIRVPEIVGTWIAVSQTQLSPRSTLLPTDLRGWLITFANPFIGAIEPAFQDAFITNVIAILKPTLCNTSGQWTADYVRLRFSATRSD